ncbi:Tryptase gamma [Halocaridina rubra]|uniref:Tryptase gamma n=1 Tax=Halocaridina rubra TaxID=373956 RepID=A0AAN9A0X2_HALRR
MITRRTILSLLLWVCFTYAQLEEDSGQATTLGPIIRNNGQAMCGVKGPSFYRSKTEIPGITSEQEDASGEETIPSDEGDDEATQVPILNFSNIGESLHPDTLTANLKNEEGENQSLPSDDLINSAESYDSDSDNLKIEVGENPSISDTNSDNLKIEKTETLSGPSSNIRNSEGCNEKYKENLKNEEVVKPPVSSGDSGNSSSDPFLSTSDWGVPHLSDTLFAEYAGEHSHFMSKITFGVVAGVREFPWQVALAINGKFQCGGSLISDNHVLTASHCVISYRNVPSAIELSLGDWDLRSSGDGQNLKVKVVRVTTHPNYNKHTLQNDVAVLKLDRKVTFNERIRPICLPASNFNLDGHEAIVTGWGRNENKKLQPQLHHLRARVLNNTICDQRWTTQGAPKGFIVNTMMCMDTTNGDSCNADSGGPSIYEYPDGSGQYIQVGIVAFGSGSCTDAHLPGVYMRVTHFTKWIRQQLF